MSQGARLALIGLVPLLVLLICLYLFRPILLPFLVGMAAAYLLDPAADRLQRMGLRRTAATIVISFSFFLALALALLLLLPTVAAQAMDLARELPEYLERLRDRLLPHLSGIASWASIELDLSAEGLLRRYWTQTMEILINAIGGLLQSGIALLNLVSLLFVTPIVTFYMLRDWDRMVARIEASVPPDYLPTVRRLARETDEVLAGFIRGQGLVCLFLALFYALGLWLVGLRYGLIIGLLTGFFSFIPYLGMAIGACVGLTVAAFQFQDLIGVGLVAAVFAAWPVHRRQPDLSARGGRSDSPAPGVDDLCRAGGHGAVRLPGDAACGAGGRRARCPGALRTQAISDQRLVPRVVVGGAGAVSEQLRLDFEHAPATGAEDFMPGECNREALAWLARWPEWPYPALILHGPPGSGKSHLARIWAARTGARSLRPCRARQRGPERAAHLGAR